MSTETPPPVSDAMREAVAQQIREKFGLPLSEAYLYANEVCPLFASEIARLTGERDAARELSGLTWTAPDIDAVGRWAEDKGAAGIRERMNRLFRRATAAEEQVRQLLNDADRAGHDHATVANDRAEATEAALTSLRAEYAEADARRDEEIARLRAALEEIATSAPEAEPEPWDGELDTVCWNIAKTARAALANPETTDV